MKETIKFFNHEDFDCIHTSSSMTKRRTDFRSSFISG